jgi:pyruvate dehydrogenase E1 component alpha subunit
MTALAERRSPSVQHLDVDDRRRLLHYLLLTRAVEERGLSLYKQGKVPGSFYDGRGQEAIAVGAAYALGHADPVCPLIRDMGAHLVKGTPVAAILGQYLGRADGVSAGREGNIHFGDWRRAVVPMVSMLPDMMVVATGMAMGFKLRDEHRCALSFFGDGATSPGAWHEAMNWAAVGQLPVIFVLENNQLAYSTTQAQQFRVNPIERARGYGMPGVTVDGNDVEAVFEVVRQAREHALAGEGPTLIEAVTMRMHGHGAHDDARYVPPELIEEWQVRDPIALQTERVRALGVDVEAVAQEVQALVADALTAALAMPPPDPATVLDGLYCEGEPEIVGAGAAPWSGHAMRAS